MVISVLINVILVTLSTIYLQFQGHFVPISLRSVLGIVAEYVTVQKRQKNQRSNWQHSLDHRERKGIPGMNQLYFINYTKAFDCVDQNKLWKVL